MQKLSLWEWFLMLGAAYLALSSLATLMRARRDSLIAELSRQANAAEHAKKLAERKAKREAQQQAAKAKATAPTRTQTAPATPVRKAA